METRRGNMNIGAATEAAAGAEHLMETAFAFWRATLLLNAEEIGLFAALACGPADAATLRERLGLNEAGEEMAADLLDALAVVGLIERCDGGYRNTAAAARFLDPALPSYLGDWLDMARAAQHETTAAMDRLRAAAVQRREEAAATGRMWEEIAAIVASAA